VVSGDPLASARSVPRPPEDPDQLLEFGLPRHERRRDLDHGVTAVVGTADQAALEQLRR